MLRRQLWCCSDKCHCNTTKIPSLPPHKIKNDAVVAFGGKKNATTAVALETAHPAKFPDEIRAITGVEPAMAPSLEGIEGRPEHFPEMEVDYQAFKNHLQKEYAA